MHTVQSVQLLQLIPNDTVKTANTKIFSYLSIPLVCYLNAPLSPKFNGANHLQEEMGRYGCGGRGRELGVVSTPGWNGIIFLVWIPSYLVLGLLGVIFVRLLTVSASLLFLFQSKSHDIPKFYHMWYVYICWMLGFWLCSH